MMDLFSELFNMFDDFDSVFAANATQRESKTCPVCGYTWSDFNRSGKFGCGECYKTFQDGSERVLRQIHSTSAHSGKIPSKSGAEVKLKRKLEDLRKQLKEAVNREDYESAAKLHSQIKEIEGGGIK
ncbi:MAG: UvrB/UvrC motif-containing protein [Clostridia bacterium]|jgi:protein arginine kinase activator|nr:UvrB/UvrC motif-containing protein [Clostridia bacterium]